MYIFDKLFQKLGEKQQAPSAYYGSTMYFNN